MELVFLIMVELANRLASISLSPNSSENSERFFLSELRKYFVFIAVTLLCLILMLNIKTVGGLPSSPYASFLSSFPVFCMVLIFGEITLKSCIKALILLLAAFFIVEITSILLGATLISMDTLDVAVLNGLSYATLVITIIANILSILLSG